MVITIYLGEDGQEEMNCPNCRKETIKITTVCDDDGKPFSFCPLCPRPADKKIDFPNIVTSKRSRGRPPRKMERTQALTDGVRVVDTAETRDRDARDKKRETVYIGSDNGAMRHRNTIAMKKLIGKFGHDKFIIKKDDGFKIVAEAIN